MTSQKRVTWEGKNAQGKRIALSKVYNGEDGLNGEIAIISAFRAEFSSELPPYKPGTSITAYIRKFRVERIAQ